MNNLDEINVSCTDNGKTVKGYILNFRERSQLEVSINTVKIRFNYQNGVYVGSMSGLEFVVKENDLPKDTEEYQR
ncbi:hypothetical protein N9472_03020 [Methylophilaceae bacterium]|nr:hypothetical protein [Methylophilaceae bacterium]